MVIQKILGDTLGKVLNLWNLACVIRTTLSHFRLAWLRLKILDSTILKEKPLPRWYLLAHSVIMFTETTTWDGRQEASRRVWGTWENQSHLRQCGTSNYQGYTFEKIKKKTVWDGTHLLCQLPGEPWGCDWAFSILVLPTASQWLWHRMDVKPLLRLYWVLHVSPLLLALRLKVDFWPPASTRKLRPKGRRTLSPYLTQVHFHPLPCSYTFM